MNRCFVVLALTWFLATHASTQLVSPEVVITDTTVRIHWQPDVNVMLQVSRSLRGGDWRDLPETLDRSTYSARRDSRPNYYRLVRLGEDFATLLTLHRRVVDRVTSQIRRATEADVNPIRRTGNGQVPLNDGDFGTPGGAFAWISQPGMIRTYRDKTEEFAFPLFSTDEFISEPTQVDQLGDAIAGLRGTDLNASIEIGPNKQLYPILDPRLITEDRVEGLAVLDSANIDLSAGLPMVVPWLYLLEDGTLGTVNEAGIFNGTLPPTPDNPVVARVAYWTDDESCKINVNTASEAIPWDIPRADSGEERDFGLHQPMSQEVQRYSGHPAMTCLSSVLFPDHYASRFEPEENRLTEPQLEAIYAVSSSIHSGNDSTLFESIDAWAEHAVQEPLFHGDPTLGRAHGLLTTESSAPETNVHGRPRMSLWPVHENADPSFQSDYDQSASALAMLDLQRYYFQRRNAASPYVDFYLAGDRNNANLYNYLMSQVYRPIPGVGGSLAQKYGATMRYFDFRDPFEYKLDHAQNLLMMFDYIRSVNLLDSNVDQPFASIDTSSMGQVTGLSMIGRQLGSDDGTSQHPTRFYEPTLEPKGIGRDYVVSEVAMVLYNTAEVTLRGWDNGVPKFGAATGGSGDARVIQQILANQHPKYAEWMGREFGPADVGKTFAHIEVGLIPELFCVGQGYHPIHPRMSLRLQTGGKGYRRGLDEFTGLKVNGIPLLLWGDSLEMPNGQFEGPATSTVDPQKSDFRFDVPREWFAWGGPGGIRAMRFGNFTLSRENPGFSGSQFLANGTGPLSHLYCQTGVIVESNGLLTITQKQPLQLLVHNATGPQADESTLVQTMQLQFPPTVFDVPGRNSGSYSGWTRRFRSAASSGVSSPVFVLDPGENKEAVKSLTVSHGDYRHVAAKRNVPREMYRAHPLNEKATSAHSLTWSSLNGTSIERNATFAADVVGRGLVEGVDYDADARTDFTFDPKDRDNFAPLLHPTYRFPIDPSITRDWDNGTGNAPDGPYTNKPDDGGDMKHSPFTLKVPYFEGTDLYYEDDPENFNPHRMIPSPVSFGSLPSAVQANAPWTCLLFRPNLSDQPHLGERGNGLKYIGDVASQDAFLVPQFQSLTRQTTLPADHHWLDLFWMPPVLREPLTESLATAGKVNMNYEIIPFKHIKRSTALHAVLKSERLLCIPSEAGPFYKLVNSIHSWRKHIDTSETLKQFEDRFAQGKHFITESEICEQFLIPEGERWDANGESIRAFWDNHRLTGDNSLERPYANIYPRLTTRSNVFRIHMQLELLDDVALIAGNRLGNTATVRAAYRGNTVVERFLDTTDPQLPNYIDDIHQDRLRLEHFYKFRNKRVESY